MYLNGYTFLNIIQNPYYIMDIFCLCCQAVTWQLALRKAPLFWAYLWMSSVYIIILFASHFIFGESITTNNIIGCLFIACGIIFINCRGEHLMDSQKAEKSLC